MEICQMYVNGIRGLAGFLVQLPEQYMDGYTNTPSEGQNSENLSLVVAELVIAVLSTLLWANLYALSVWQDRNQCLQNYLDRYCPCLNMNCVRLCCGLQFLNFQVKSDVLHVWVPVPGVHHTCYHLLGNNNPTVLLPSMCRGNDLQLTFFV